MLSRPFDTGILLPIALALAVGACSSGPRIAAYDWPAPAEMARLTVHLDSLLLDSAFADATWAAHVVDLRSGRTLYSRNARKNLIPASNAKLFTTAAALDQIGPDFRYETVLSADGEIRADTLLGDLVVKGSGDPSLSKRYLDDPLSIFRSWSDSLVKRGVRVVAGDVVGDERLFDSRRLGPAWSWDDEPYYYSAQISALSFNDNCVFLTSTGTAAGMPAALSWMPLDTDYVSVENRTVTVESASPGFKDNFRRRGTNHIVALSRVPEGSSFTECVTVENPALFFAHIVREVVVQSGIHVVGRARQRSAPGTEGQSVGRESAQDASPTLLRLASYRSPPLSRIVYQVNKDSDNLDAELVLRSLGVYRSLADSTSRTESAEAGIAALALTLAKAGIDTAYVGLVDGSGLSRHNLVTAFNVTRLLEYMSRHESPAVEKAFRASLPVGGLDGTLKHRYRDGAPAGLAVAAKTGTMTFVSSLSGYVQTASGRPLAFSLICNNYSSTTSYVRGAQDGFVNFLAGI